MRKNRILEVMCFLLLSISIFSKTINVAGMKDLLKIATQISKTQMGMETEMLDQGMKMIRQIENEMAMIEQGATNLKKLKGTISNTNIDNLNSTINKIMNLQSDANSFIYKQEKIVDEYWDLYKKSPDDFENITGFNPESLVALDVQVMKAKQMKNNAVYDAMVQSGFSAKLGQDRDNIKMLLEASKTADGALQAQQATNNLIGQTNSTLLEIRTLLETGIKLAATVEANANNIANADERTNKELVKQMNDYTKEEVEKTLEMTKKKFVL